MVRQKGD